MPRTGKLSTTSTRQKSIELVLHSRIIESQRTERRGEQKRGLASSTSWSPRTRSSVAACRLPDQPSVIRRAILNSSDIHRRRRLFLLIVGFHFLPQKSNSSAQRSFSITQCSLRFDTTSIPFPLQFLLPLSNALHLFRSIDMIHCGTAQHLLNTVVLLSLSSLLRNDPCDDQTSTEDQRLSRLTHCNSAEMRSRKCRRWSPIGQRNDGTDSRGEMICSLESN